MKKQRAWARVSALSAAGISLAMLAACGGSAYNSNNKNGGGKRPSSSTIFTYDTYTQVMVDS